MSQSGSQKKSGFSLWFRKKTSKNIPNNNFSSEQLRVIQSWRLNDFLIEPIDVVQRSISTRNQGASGLQVELEPEYEVILPENLHLPRAGKLSQGTVHGLISELRLRDPQLAKEFDIVFENAATPLEFSLRGISIKFKNKTVGFNPF